MEYGIVLVSPTNWNDWQLSKNGFHWENVKHLIIMLVLVQDTGAAVQKSFCAKLEVFEILIWIQYFSTC